MIVGLTGQKMLTSRRSPPGSCAAPPQVHLHCCEARWQSHLHNLTESRLRNQPYDTFVLVYQNMFFFCWYKGLGVCKTVTMPACCVNFAMQLLELEWFHLCYYEIYFIVLEMCNGLHSQRFTKTWYIKKWHPMQLIGCSGWLLIKSLILS